MCRVQTGCALVATCMIGLLPALTQATEPAPTKSGSPPAVNSRIDIRVSPVVDMHFWLKSLIRKNDADVPTAFREAVAVLREYGKSTKTDGPPWSAIESNLAGCNTVDELRATLSQLPEHSRRRTKTGEPLELRGPAVKVADAYKKFEAAFLRDYWPDHKRQIDARLRDIRDDFAPKIPACLAYMLEKLGMEDPAVTIPVDLVVDMPWPGAHTYRLFGGGALSIVSISRDEFAGSLLYESILHESTHALDIAAGRNDVFDAIRRKLEAVGFSKGDDAYRNVPHTIMFVQAAETIRRIVNPEHKHYGVVSKYYERVSRPGVPIGNEVRDVWTRYLDGKISREEAVDTLVKWTRTYAGKK